MELAANFGLMTAHDALYQPCDFVFAESTSGTYRRLLFDSAFQSGRILCISSVVRLIQVRRVALLAITAQTNVKLDPTTGAVQAKRELHHTLWLSPNILLLQTWKTASVNL